MAKNDWVIQSEVPEGKWIPTSETVDDPAAAGSVVAPQIPPEVVQSTGWGEMLFPRVVREKGSLPFRLAGDVSSGIGRAYASLARPEGEDFQTAMARTTASPRAGERGMLPFQEFSENMLRDPVNFPLAVVTSLTGGLTAPAWLARMGWAGKGLQAGVPAGITIAAGRQAGNLSAGRPMSGKEAATDAALGTLLGLGGSALGRGMEAAGRAAVPAAMKIAKVVPKWREGVEEALPEMIRRGILAPTRSGMLANDAKIYADITGRYQRATAGMQDLPAVSLRQAAQTAEQKITDAANRGKIIPDNEAPVVSWINEVGARPLPASGAFSAGMVDVPTAIASRSAARKAAGSYESLQPSSMRREAMQDAADTYAGAINERLQQVAPAVRQVDKFAKPYYQFQPYLDALGRRGNNYEIGLTELGAGAIGGALGANAMGAGGGVAGAIVPALLARLQRSPALPFFLNKAGEKAGAPLRASSLGQFLIAPPADNARGR